MIPFDEIDNRLALIGRDRKWLAEATGRNYSAVGAALSPNAQAKYRSKLLQKALSDAIEAEEARQQSPSGRIVPPGHMEFVLSDAQYQKVKTATQMAGYPSMSDFCRVAIEEAADRILEAEAYSDSPLDGMSNPLDILDLVDREEAEAKARSQRTQRPTKP